MHETTGPNEKTRESNVMLSSLPAHITHYQQPLERRIFLSFKTAYDKLCSEHLKNPDTVVSKATWSGLSWQVLRRQ